MEYKKLSELQEFKVNTVGKPYWFKWDASNNKPEFSDNWKDGFQKKYDVECDGFKIAISRSQLGQMLESVSYMGEASIIGREFAVKTNGKQGMEIRYFINPKPRDYSTPTEPPKRYVTDELKESDISIEDVPF